MSSFNAQKVAKSSSLITQPVNVGVQGEIFELVENAGDNGSKLEGELFQSRYDVSPITNSDISALKKTFGVTTNYDFVGYLLLDGEMLDFSGRHWGNDYPSGREVDHRDVLEAFDYEGPHDGDNDVKAMVDMISSGNIRLSPEVGGINIAIAPTQKQIQPLVKRFS